MDVEEVYLQNIKKNMCDIALFRYTKNKYLIIM